MAGQSITITGKTELDVHSKYTKLINKAMSEDSPYISAKDAVG